METGGKRSGEATYLTETLGQKQGKPRKRRRKPIGLGGKGKGARLHRIRSAGSKNAERLMSLAHGRGNALGSCGYLSLRGVKEGVQGPDGKIGYGRGAAS